MAIIINSKFRPFSMDEMLKVVMPAAQMQKETEDALGEIDALSSVWEKLKGSEIDRDVYNQYRNFQDSLTQSIDDVYRNGVNVNTRRALSKMRSRYAKEITPIEEAYNRRNALAEEQRQAMLKDDSIMWQNKANKMKLRDIMNNPSIDYGRAVSGDKLTARVAASASALAKEYQDNPEKLKSLVGGDYYEYIKKRRFSSSSILAAITDLVRNKDNIKNYNPELDNVLQRLVIDEVNSSGIDETWADNALSRAVDYGSKGLWQAIGQDEAQIIENWRKQQAMSQAFQASEAEKNRNFQREQMQPRQMLDDNGNPTDRYYDPKLGVITDKDGLVYPNQAGGVKPPTGNAGSGRTPLTPEERAENDLAKKEYEALANVSSYDSMMKTGYRPTFITASTGDKWYSLNEGEDLPDTWGGYTDSNLITRGTMVGNAFWWNGDATFNPKRKGKEEGGVRHVAVNSNYVNELTANMTLPQIFQKMYPNIPTEAMNSMVNKMVSSGIIKFDEKGNPNIAKSFEIFRVRSERGNGNSYDDWDYMVNIKD